MLSVYTKKGFIPIETRQNYYYLMNYDGFHQLSFDVSISDKINNYLINEAIIQNEDNRFLIKDINRRTKNVTITCELDMDEWKETVFFDTANDARFQTKTMGDILNVIKPFGWTILNSGIRTIRRTPELKDCTPYDILLSLEELFGIVFDINVLNKEVKIIDPESFAYDGLYATHELNMKGITWQGSSSDFCTKLFAYGKTYNDGNTVNISSVNGGKEYIEDHTYTDKVITLVWRDERYTNPQSLYDDARKKLNVLCVPKMSYDISIYDLSQMNDEYNFLQFGLYKMVKTMLNKDISILQRVVTYKKYYDKPDKNIITLSNEQQKFTSKVSSMLGGNINNTVNGSFLDQAKKEAASIVNDFATKGHRYATENEMYFLDKMPKEEAKYVMRMNLGGIAFSTNGWSGPYITAWTIDGRFNADFIATGTLEAIKIKAAEIIGGSININDMFIVDRNGVLKCVGGDFDGKITAISGKIGGFSLEADGLHASFTKILPSNYSQADKDRIENIILGKVTPTQADYDRLDVNGDGIITSADFLSIERMILGWDSNIWKYTFHISSQTPENFISYTLDKSGSKSSITTRYISLAGIDTKAMKDLNDRISELERKLA